MATDSIIDIDALLSPISEENPAGEELSIVEPGSSLLRTKDAWDEARKLVKEQIDKERSGGIDSQGQAWRLIPPVNWADLIEKCSEILATQSKDFRVAAWLTEALLREHSAAGLRAGLTVCLGLCENFWDNIRPAPTDDDGHGGSVGPFAGFVSDAGVGALNSIVLVAGQKPGEREKKRYNVLDHQRGKELELVADSADREQLIESGHVTSLEFQAVAAVTDREFFDALTEDITACLDKLGRLDAFLRDNCRDDQYDEPTYGGMSAFREKLVSIQKLVRELRGEDPTAEDLGGAVESGGTEGGPVTMNREIAFQTIERMAQFFERTEPHSPVTFVLRQAVRWGRLPLPELWNELIDDNNSMDRIRKLVGLPQPPEEQ